MDVGARKEFTPIQEYQLLCERKVYPYSTWESIAYNTSDLIGWNVQEHGVRESRRVREKAEHNGEGELNPQYT